MRALVLVHRWLGVVFCLLFAMWFATGVVMHFVPFPALTEAERVGGLALVDRASVAHDAQAAIDAAKLPNATRVRLFQRSDGPVFIVQDLFETTAVRADDLSPAAVRSDELALEIGIAHARTRSLQFASARVEEMADYDQWTVPNALDPHRPLYRIALDDEAGTELYVSSKTGEIVRDATRNERRWNYAGSVVHWIYPTALRSHWQAWDTTVWALSLAALVAALTGALLGFLRLRVSNGRPASPFRGWQAWHHWLGIASMTFVLSWILSGWLSMDHGRLFSRGNLTAAEAAVLRNASFGERAFDGRAGRLPADGREIEWFAFGGTVYRRERLAVHSQRLVVHAGGAARPENFLTASEIEDAARELDRGCSVSILADTDAYPVVSAMPGAPVYRVVCGETWFHVDGASGAPLEKLDASRRVYRWLYQALHTLDFPALVARPALRTLVIVILCSLGFFFSVTALVIAWRRLRATL